MEHYKYRQRENIFDDITFYNFEFVDGNNCKKDSALNVEGFVMLYVFSGKGSVDINGKNQVLSNGDLLLIKPRANIKINSKNDIKYCYVDIDGRKIRNVFKIFDFIDEIYVLKSCDKNIEEQFIEIIEICKKERYFVESGVCSCIFKIFYELSKYKEIKTKAPFFNNEHVQKAIDYIEKNYSEYCGLEDIAQHVGLNTNYLSNLFKDVVHVSISTYVINVRIKNACRLLRNVNMSIADIAYMVGYSDVVYFSKEFKKKMGMSPSIYAKKARLSNV